MAKLDKTISSNTQILVDILTDSTDVARCTTNNYYDSQCLITFHCAIALEEDVPLLAINKNMILGNIIWKNGIEGEDLYYFF